MGKYVLFLCCVFVRSEKKIVDSSKCFFICHWLCAIPELYVMWFVDIFSHFCPFPSLGIEKSGVVDFFPLSLRPVHKIKVWKKCEDLKHYVQRENIEWSMLLLMLLFCN